MTRTLIAMPLLLVLILSTSGSAYAQNATIDLNATVDNDAGVLDASTTADTSVDADTDTRSVINSSGSASGSVDSGFSLRKGDDKVEASNTSTIASDSVNTESDLEAYAASTIRSSNTIDRVDADAESLRVSFTEDARLFWFIPFAMRSTLEVSADGEVRLVRPWYSFLASVPESKVDADLESRVRTVLEGEGTLTARSQARVIEALSMHFDGAQSASASLDADVRAETDTSLPVDESTDDERTPMEEAGTN